MADEERIFQLLAKIEANQAEMRRDINGINTSVSAAGYAIEKLKNGYETMRADVTRIQLDAEKIRDTQYNLVEHVDALRGSVGQLENNVTHELRMLNELLPDALAKREAFEEVTDTVDDHSNRISALEKKAANG